jgi:hypothetical protein
MSYCLIEEDTTFNAMLDKSGESTNPCFAFAIFGDEILL